MNSWYCASHSVHTIFIRNFKLLVMSQNAESTSNVVHLFTYAPVLAFRWDDRLGLYSVTVSDSGGSAT